ncbi:hypothetical protein [Caballeronia sp. Lep1P3]|uniref:hypothetical protein n=1 Tax=Caballeronia sp. Lep1P3 TaxID=2878150 RepID=UPI00025B9DB0|nr:hypothetical protein [Caballeronia sp. Lep1P3]EKS72773.1 hypothetical protein BURK_004952 [Burkholderia sp. SJ98]
MTVALARPCQAQPQPSADATVQQPRAFGHVLGDVLTQRVLLSIDGHEVRDIPPPSTGRVSVWLERRQPHIEKDAQGRPWMVIDYQIINAAERLTQAEVPAFDLRATTGGTLRVAAWPISIGTLTPPASFRAGDLQPLRPDRIVTPQNQVETRHRIMAMLALLLVTLLSWMAWWSWRTREDARRLPFARAWQAVCTLNTDDIDTNDQAWRALHHAFNETAGEVVHAASLYPLLVRAPWLEKFKTELEVFYSSSQQRFFVHDSAPARFPLREFARTLYRAERKQ